MLITMPVYAAVDTGYGINEAIGKTKNMKKAEYDKEIEKVKSWYKKAEPFFLKVKELEPDDPTEMGFSSEDGVLYNRRKG